MLFKLNSQSSALYPKLKCNSAFIVESGSPEDTSLLSAVLHATCCFLLGGGWGGVGGRSLLSMALVA